MNTFDYADEQIGKREVWVAVSSMVIGTGILTLPSALANRTEAADGWVPLLAAGIVSMLFAWIAAKLSSRFPKQTFLSFSTAIIGKTPAVLLSLMFGIMFLGIAASSTREIANIAKLYLFDRTPLEVVALVFLLPVVYAAAGSSITVLRLNVLFLPVVITIICFVLVFNLHFVKVGELLPVFTTEPSGYLRGWLESSYAYLGYGNLLYYAVFMKQPKQAPRAALLGMSLPIVLYILIYVMSIGILTNAGTANIVYPTVEIAKEVEVPGHFFERFESIFFTIWIMTIFNTVAMSVDLSAIALVSVFPRFNKLTWLLIVVPAAYLLSMQPQNTLILEQYQEWLSYYGLLLCMTVPALLLLVAVLRKVQGSG